MREQDAGAFVVGNCGNREAMEQLVTHSKKESRKVIRACTKIPEHSKKESRKVIRACTKIPKQLFKIKYHQWTGWSRLHSCR